MVEPRAVLVVDDDAALRGALAEQLRVNGEFAPEEAASLAEARARLHGGGHYDALLLDAELPDGDGRDFCRALREQGVREPIIILTASTEEADMVRGLEAGANDCLTKPFRLNELLARLRAHLRSFARAEEAETGLGPFRFRPGARQLIDPQGAKIRLTDKETAILRYLQRAAKVVTRQELLGAVWGYNQAVTTHTLETHVYRLRRKIEAEPQNARLLVTVNGGYRLNA
ncbi:response regulator transcription factor [Acidocella sp.]|uniref:response regulator transcription factor n=1 Tax=Acidocella sp. TaxID=50710 RepID=UPI00262155E1|nr:response regulator transcription factor [Acidocella sp.]